MLNPQAAWCRQKMYKIFTWYKIINSRLPKGKEVPVKISGGNDGNIFSFGIWYINFSRTSFKDTHWTLSILVQYLRGILTAEVQVNRNDQFGT
jgi:hypothetical protein